MRSAIEKLAEASSLGGITYERVLATTFSMTFMRGTNSTAQEKTSPARVLDSPGGSDAHGLI